MKVSVVGYVRGKHRLSIILHGTSNYDESVRCGYGRKRRVPRARFTNLEEADPFVGEQSDGLERDGADTRSRYPERVKGRSVGLVGGGHHPVEVNLWTKGGGNNKWV